MSNTNLFSMTCDLGKFLQLIKSPSARKFKDKWPMFLR